MAQVRTATHDPSDNKLPSGDAAPPLSPTSALYPMGPAQREALIRRAAYILYERRGRIDGFADEDWLRAEALIDRVLLGQLSRELFASQASARRAAPEWPVSRKPG